MAALVWPQVIREPVVQEDDPASGDPGLHLDLGIRGVWQPQVEALFDIHVIDTDAPSRGEAIMLVKLSIILFCNSHNFTYYAHRFYLLFSKLCLV